MKIIGFTLSKILAEKPKNLSGKIDIKSGLNIDDVSEEEISLPNSEALKFDFTYDIKYSADIAKIEFKGSVLMLDDKKEGKEILKDWKKKKFDHSIKMPLFNFIMEKCNLKALQLEEEIGLPFHIPMPKLAPNTKSADSAKDASKEQNNANYAG